MGVRSSYRLSKLLWLALAVAGLALASQVEVPLKPVPVTLQTLAVILTGFLLGPRLGFLAVAIWLVGGAGRLPIFAEGKSGVSVLTGPTAGFLLSFPFAAALAGFGSAKAKGKISWLFLTAIAAHLLILAAGGLWLSTKVGGAAALQKGMIPFVPGAVLKSAIAAMVMKIIEQVGSRRVRAPEAPRH